jgi:hypothetical protein
MQAPQKSPTRKKFLQWGAAIIASAAMLKLVPGKKKEKPDTITMLTEDGKLVEIDRKAIAGTKRRNITGPELKDWVKNK